jgi:hypothetical protein
MTAPALFGIAMVTASVTLFMVGGTRDDTRSMAEFLGLGTLFSFFAILAMVLQRDEHPHTEEHDDQRPPVSR